MDGNPVEPRLQAAFAVKTFHPAKDFLTPIALAIFPNAVTPAIFLMASPQFSQDMGSATTNFLVTAVTYPRDTAIPSNR